ncbi:hypothetical protein ACO11K_004532 [Bacillus cytotoxicus]|nr:hypothetical protein [Bacillus cereus group sp. BfR-BA-01492]EMA6343139.1 hypothetical protein [Bacillus cytotoxicus]EMA6345265.1 hypothetical protein [Bacillus cytotoxicus]
MNKQKNDYLWKLFKIWLSIPRSARLAFLWAIILGFSYLGWVKIIRQIF